MSSFSRVLLVFILCLFSPILFWLAIAEVADQPAYLALVRSGLLLVGLTTIGWAGLRDRPRMVWLGLALIGIGFLTFYCGRCWAFPLSGLFESSWLWAVKQRLAMPIAPTSRITLWHALVGGAVVLNAALLLSDVDLRRVLAANLIFGMVFVLACVLAPF